MSDGKARSPVRKIPDRPMHWTRMPVSDTHVMDRDGQCRACGMRREWPGSRDACRLHAAARAIKRAPC